MKSFGSFPYLQARKEDTQSFLGSDSRYACPESTTKDSFRSSSHSHQCVSGVEISVGVKGHDSYTQSTKIHGKLGRSS